MSIPLKSMRDVTASDVHKIVHQKDAVIIDVLAPESYAKHHVPGSVNIPSTDPQFLEKVRDEVPDKNAPVVFYCSGPTCDASPTAAKRVEEAGYQDVREFRGGLQEWENAGFTFEGRSGAI